MMFHHARPPESREPDEGPDARKSGGITSAHLRQLNEEAVHKGSLSIGEMVATMGASSIAFTILVLALPALTPIPGPFGMVFGSCLAIVSLQIIAGAQHLKLPRFVAGRRISADTIALIVRNTAPAIARIESRLRPDRLPSLAGPTAQRLLGIPVFLLAIAIALPIPFGNVLPVIALIVIATALLEQDGLAATVGLVLSIVALSVTIGLLYGAHSVTSWLLA